MVGIFSLVHVVDDCDEVGYVLSSITCELRAVKVVVFCAVLVELWVVLLLVVLVQC